VSRILQRATRLLVQCPALFLRSSGFLLLPILVVGVTACGEGEGRSEAIEARTIDHPAPDDMEASPDVDIQQRVDQYATVPLSVDLGDLSDGEREAVSLLIEAARIMDDLFWRQAFGDPAPLLAGVSDDPDLLRYTEINHGPWDRLAGNEPFVTGFGPKPSGANFYPADMTARELEAAAEAAPDGGETLRSLYTLVRRDDAGSLTAIPYHEAFSDRLREASRLLNQAADRVETESLARYLRLRAEALLTGEYRESDRAWLDMKDNRIEVVIGPIETYEDRLLGSKAAFEAFILLKDMEWSRRLSRFPAFLPEMQAGLPVPEAYKRELPGTDSDLNAYHALYYAGDANAGSKTIAINLPNDEQVQMEKGTRRLQLENAMRAKFDEILVPISEVLIHPGQREHVTFDSFFGNTMFHEVAHGLGVKQTLDGESTVREALREHASAVEEGKADILGLYLVSRLRERDEITEGSLEDDYVTFLAGIFRSVRFGASSAHGRANMVRFNFFRDMGAFHRDPDTGTYRVDMERMSEAVGSLSERILRIQGDGDYEAAGRLLAEEGVVGEQLRSDLDRLTRKGIPVDIVFEQGPSMLEGLE